MPASDVSPTHTGFRRFVPLCLAALLLGAPDGGRAAARPEQPPLVPWIRQETYFKASNPEPFDFFGGALALSGDTLAVGASDEDSAPGAGQADNSQPQAGAVYVFVRTVSGWQQQAFLKSPASQAGDRFGSSVALDGDTLVVNTAGRNDEGTAFGVAYVFVREGTAWTLQATLRASNAEADDGFGGAVIDGDTIVVGAGGEDSAATGVGGDQSDNSAPNSGAAYVFVRDGTTWTQQAYLKASNTEAGDGFGGLALDGDMLAVSAGGEDSAATVIGGDQSDNSAADAGAVYVFVRNGATWSQHAYIKPSEARADDLFGGDLGLKGGVLAVGAARRDRLPGAAYVFGYANGAWAEQARLGVTYPFTYRFGSRIAVGDGVVAIRANDDSAARGIDGDPTACCTPQSGAVFAFARAPQGWALRAYIKSSNSDQRDLFGTMLAINGRQLAVGAIGESSAATGVDGEQDSNDVPFAGAVYLFGLARLDHRVFVPRLEGRRP